MDGKKRTKPSTIEVIDAIFSIFTPEEMEYMKNKTSSKNIKDLFYDCQDALHPRYSLERSVYMAKRIVDPIREELGNPSTLERIRRELLLKIFT